MNIIPALFHRESAVEPVMILTATAEMFLVSDRNGYQQGIRIRIVYAEGERLVAPPVSETPFKRSPLILPCSKGYTKGSLTVTSNALIDLAAGPAPRFKAGFKITKHWELPRCLPHVPERDYRSIKNYDRYASDSDLTACQMPLSQTSASRNKKHDSKQTTQQIDPQVAPTCSSAEMGLDEFDDSPNEQNRRHDEKKLLNERPLGQIG
jgi:hypothetical protein